jgi:serine/threonine protein kinase
MISNTIVELDVTGKLPMQGANSQTYLGYDEKLDRDVVIKEIKDSTSSSVTDYFNEARLACLAQHNLVMPIYYVGFDSSTSVARIVTPYYSNGCLQSEVNTLLSSHKLLSIKQVMTYGIDIAQGVTYLHSCKILHLDIKPSNIIISNTRKPIITDFGQSKIIGSNKRLKMYPKCIAPENFSNKASKKTDIYQFGLLLYRLCNENLMLQQQKKYEKNMQLFHSDVTQGLFPDRGKYNFHVPNSLITIINKCLEVDPTKRYLNFRDVSKALSEAAGYDLNLDFSNNKMCGKVNDREYTFSYNIKEENSIDLNVSLDDLVQPRMSKHGVTEPQLRSAIKETIQNLG